MPRKRSNKKRKIDELKKAKGTRRKYLEETNKLHGADVANKADKLMMKSVENEVKFVRRTIEIALTDVDNIYDLPQAATAIARFWNTELLGVIGKMEMVLDGIIEFEVEKSKIYADELQGKRKIAVTKEDFMYIVNQILEDLSSFDRA